MKFPKNRANLYLVERWTYDGNAVVVGAFNNLEAADAYKDACLQEWIDKGLREEDVSFSVGLTTFYDA